MSERQEKTAVARYWAEQVEAVRGLDQDDYRVLLWEAQSESSDGGPVAAGVVQMPPGGIGLEALAFGLRDLLKQATGDPSISVAVFDQEDENAGDAEAWSGRGVAEFHQPNPYEDDDPEEYEHYDQEDDAVMAAEVAEVMRDSAEWAERAEHLPDGARILPQHLDGVEDAR